MTNNDILRRLRYSLNYNDQKMITVFYAAEAVITKQQLSSWLTKEEEPDYANLADNQLAHFLNGLINEKRGKKEGPQAIAEKKLTNNLILKKLKIAFNLKAEDIIDMLAKVNFNLGKAELSALFRQADHKHYRECKDQILRNFLQALQVQYRPVKEIETKKAPKKRHSEPTEQKKINKSSARPSASKIYVNPKASKPKQAKEKPKRKVLKLTPEQVWGKKD